MRVLFIFLVILFGCVHRDATYIPAASVEPVDVEKSSYKSASRENTLTGAFGFQIGEKFDKNLDKFSGFVRKDEREYFRIDKSPKFSWVDYSKQTLIFGRDKEIYLVGEENYVPDKKTCENGAKDISKLLSDNYNLPPFQVQIVSKGRQFSIKNHKGLDLIVGCEKRNDKDVILVVVAKSLDRLSENNKIKGAFGFEFGKILSLDSGNYYIKDRSKDGSPIMIELRNNLERPFSYYRVMFSPKARIIHSIGAYAEFSDIEECRENMSAYMKVAEEKYNLKSYYVSHGNMEALMLEDGTKTIMSSCNSDAEYIIVYSDNYLKEMSNEESSDLIYRTIDKSLF